MPQKPSRLQHRPWPQDRPSPVGPHWDTKVAEAEGDADPAPRDGETEDVTDVEVEGEPEAADDGDTGTQ